MTAARVHELCIFGRIPLLVILGVLIGFGAFQALAIFRIDAAERKIETIQKDVIDLRVTMSEIKYIRQTLDRIEASVGRTERKP